MERALTVGLDGSPESLAAAHWAAHEAERRSLTLLMPEPTHVPAEMDRNYWAKRLVHNARTELQAHHPGLTVVSNLVADDAQDTLLQAASESEMLVLGSWGLTPVESYFLGDGTHPRRTGGPALPGPGRDHGRPPRRPHPRNIRRRPRCRHRHGRHGAAMDGSRRGRHGRLPGDSGRQGTGGHPPARRRAGPGPAPPLHGAGPDTGACCARPHYRWPTAESPGHGFGAPCATACLNEVFSHGALKVVPHREEGTPDDDRPRLARSTTTLGSSHRSPGRACRPWRPPGARMPSYDILGVRHRRCSHVGPMARIRSSASPSPPARATSARYRRRQVPPVRGGRPDARPSPPCCAGRCGGRRTECRRRCP